MERGSEDVKLPVTFSDAESGSLAVQIMDVIYSEEKLKKAVTYKIRVNDMQGTTEVLRQYHEFVNVRKALSEMWPGIFIPPVPPKILIGNTGTGVVEDRRVVLEEFLRKTVHNSLFITSEPLQEFLKSQQKYEPKLQILSFSSEAANRYREVFGGFDHDCPADSAQVMKGTIDFLDGAYRVIKKLRKVSKSTSALYGQSIALASDVAEAAQRFERTTLSELLGQSDVQVFHCPDKDTRCNPFALISDWAKVEELDLKAMIEAIQWYFEAENNRKKAESKLSSGTSSLQKLQEGKSSLSHIFSRKGKPELMTQVEQRISQSETELQDATSLSNIICNRLLEREVPNFKETKAEQHALILKAFAAALRLEGEQGMKAMRDIESVSLSRRQ